MQALLMKSIMEDGIQMPTANTIFCRVKCMRNRDCISVWLKLKICFSPQMERASGKTTFPSNGAEKYLQSQQFNPIKAFECFLLWNKSFTYNWITQLQLHFTLEFFSIFKSNASQFKMNKTSQHKWRLVIGVLSLDSRVYRFQMQNRCLIASAEHTRWTDQQWPLVREKHHQHYN